MITFVYEVVLWTLVSMTSFIALMGFFVLAGTAYAPVNAEATTSEINPATIKVAVKEEVSLERTAETVLSVKLTAYNAVPEQTDGNPFVTASGAVSNPEVIAARSHDLAGELPFGTIIAVERPEYQDPLACGYDAVEHLVGYRVIADTTHSRKRAQIDLLMNQEDTVTVKGREMNPSLALGVCGDVTIRVVGRIKVGEIPTTQTELAEIVTGGRLALR